ncbi:MAG: 6-hydroxymethylpterin diphosphokinase MptE-like protein [Opitutales bacterium]
MAGLLQHKSQIFLRNSINGLFRERFGDSCQDLESLKNKFVGNKCFILGNGPSLAHVPNRLLEKEFTFGTNGIFLKHTPNVYVSISPDYYNQHFDKIKEVSSPFKFFGAHLWDENRFVPGGNYLQCNWNIYGHLLGFKFPVPFKFSLRPDRVLFLGGTVLFVCLQIAHWMGFKKVYLLGVDHKFGFPRAEATYGGRRIGRGEANSIHFIDSYSKSEYNPHCDPIATERAFELASKVFCKTGGRLINATPDTALDVLPKTSIDRLI